MGGGGGDTTTRTEATPEVRAMQQQAIPQITEMLKANPLAQYAAWQPRQIAGTNPAYQALFGLVPSLARPTQAMNLLYGGVPTINKSAEMLFGAGRATPQAQSALDIISGMGFGAPTTLQQPQGQPFSPLQAPTDLSLFPGAQIPDIPIPQGLETGQPPPLPGTSPASVEDVTKQLFTKSLQEQINQTIAQSLAPLQTQLSRLQPPYQYYG